MRMFVFRRNDATHTAEARRARARTLCIERLTERRVLAAITGLVFEDANVTLRREVGEGILADRLVYLDTNTNGAIDAGEPWRVTDNGGRFIFNDLSSGDYQVRLFDGSLSQHQVTPRTLGELSNPIAISQFSHLSVVGTQAFGISGSQAVRVDAQSGIATKVDLPTQPSDAFALPDGRLLVIYNSVAPGIPETGASIIDFSDGNVDTVNVGLGPQEAGWSRLGLNGSGKGILVSANSSGSLRRIDTNPLSSVPTTNSVALSTNIQMGQAGNQAVLWRALPGKVAAQVYDVQTADPVGDAEVSLDDVEAILDFDDTSNAVLARRTDQRLVLLDAGNNFTQLRDLQMLGNVPAVLDGARDLVIAMDVTASKLRIYDWLEDFPPSEFSVDLAGFHSLRLLDGGDQVLFVGNNAVKTARLDIPSPFHAALVTNAATADAIFGAELTGDNEKPEVRVNITAEVNEDGTLAFGNIGTLANVFDADLDQLAYLLTESPAHGEVALSTSGAFTYKPAKDYFGTDRVSFFVHDGRASSQEIHLNIDVKPMPDRATGVQISLGPNALPLGELTLPGQILGEIFVLSPDAFDTFQFQFNDPRFNLQGNLLVVAPGAQFNFEQEPRINFVVNVQQPGVAEPVQAQLEIEVGDAPEMPTDIVVSGGSVTENVAGDAAATISVIDPDSSSNYIFSVVDDERFVFAGPVLQLVDGLALNYEQESQVLVTVQVRDGNLPGVLEKQLTITVGQVNEAPKNIQLSSRALPERHSGIVIGTLSADDEDAGQHHTFTVDDPRFEVVNGNVLKLREGEFVAFSSEQRVLLRVIAKDDGSPPMAASESLEVDVQAVANPFHNAAAPFDVDNNHVVEPMDALIIINHLNEEGPSILSGAFEENDGYFDVNNDGMVTPLDVLLLINELNHDALGESSEPEIADLLIDPAELGNTDDRRPAGAMPAPSGEPSDVSPAPPPANAIASRSPSSLGFGTGGDDEEEEETSNSSENPLPLNLGNRRRNV